jgi:agmatinase
MPVTISLSRAPDHETWEEICRFRKSRDERLPVMIVPMEGQFSLHSRDPLPGLLPGLDSDAMLQPNPDPLSSTNGDCAMSIDAPLYTGAPTFLRLPQCEDAAASEADVLILGAPFDLATTGRPGTRSGPLAIRNASAHLAWEDRRWPWDFDLARQLRVEDAGDVAVPTGDPAGFTQRLQKRAEEIVRAGKTLVSLGGDHFVSLPLLRAHAQIHGPVALIHFDAHTDTYGEGGDFDHGTMFLRANQEGLLQPEHSAQIGIRTTYARSDHPFDVLDAAWVNEHSTAECVQRIRDRVGTAAAYVTFDIDCLDPAFAPGTGTPVAGGLTSNRALQIVRGLAGLNLVGFDVVEVAPAFDHAELTSLAGATLALEFLYVLAATRRDAG